MFDTWSSVIKRRGGKRHLGNLICLEIELSSVSLS